MIKGLNWNALRFLPRVIESPYLLVPCLSAPDIRYLDFERMKSSGVKAICFDKDNVLTAHREALIYPSLKGAWEDCKRVFSPSNIAIISNSAGSEDDLGNEWAIVCEHTFGVRVIRHHRAKKPDCGETIFRHFQYQPHNIAMVGDRLMTDILMGNLSEMLTIHTRPLTLSGEPYGVHLMRSCENLLVKRSGFKQIKSPIHPHRFYNPTFILTREQMAQRYPESLNFSSHPSGSRKARFDPYDNYYYKNVEGKLTFRAMVNQLKIFVNTFPNSITSKPTTPSSNPEDVKKSEAQADPAVSDDFVSVDGLSHSELLALWESSKNSGSSSNSNGSNVTPISNVMTKGVYSSSSSSSPSSSSNPPINSKKSEPTNRNKA